MASVRLQRKASTLPLMRTAGETAGILKTLTRTRVFNLRLPNAKSPQNPWKNGTGRDFYIRKQTKTSDTNETQQRKTRQNPVEQKNLFNKNAGNNFLHA